MMFLTRSILPTYAATAWYHKRLPPDLQQLPLRDVLSQTEAFSSAEYLLALARGDAVSQSDSDRVANQLSRFTGLDAGYIKQENLREPIERFTNDLLKDQNRRSDAMTAGSPGSGFILAQIPKTSIQVTRRSMGRSLPPSTTTSDAN